MHFKVLDDLNLHVPKGAIYGFISENGAGKTTLICVITECRILRQANIIFIA